MSILNRRLWRSIKKNKMQFAAMIMIVIVGISMYVGLTGTYASLRSSQESFYAENRLSGHMFMVVNAPAEIVRRIEAVPGVESAEGRSQEDVKLVTEDGSRAQVRLTGYGPDKSSALHYPYVTKGEYPLAKTAGQSADVLADVAFVAANGLSEGDNVSVIVSGRQVKLNLAGAAVSPEYIYIIKDAGNLFPDPKGFGIVFLPQEQLASLLGRSGQISQVLITWKEGESAENYKSIEAIKDILSPYGMIADVAQKDYPSHNMLKSEIDSLKVMATTFPLLFLSVAAMVEIIILRRSINAQRLNIGIMKSQGYANLTIMMSFASYPLLVTAAGTLLGIGAGYVFGNAFTAYYGEFFHLPYTMQIMDYSSVLISAVAGPLIGIGSGMMAAAKITKIQAAQAMRAEPPKSGKTIAIEEFAFFWRMMSAQWKMAMRSACRNIGRFFVVTIGMICTTALLLLSFYTRDATNFMLETYFEGDIKYDYIVRFNNAIHVRDTDYFNTLPDVTHMEPFAEIAATIQAGGKEQDDSFMGILPGSLFKNIKDNRQNIMTLPENGIIISNVIARKTGVAAGDTVRIKTEPQPGAEKYVSLPVMGIHEQMMGYKTLCSIEQAGALMDEPGMANGIMMNVKNGHSEELEKFLDDIPKVASWSSKTKEEAAVASMMRIMPVMIATMVSLSLVLGFAVLYNTGIVNMAERRNEIATLRAIGFTAKDVRGILFKETLVQSVVGYAAGLPLGYLMIVHYMGSLSSDLYTFPVIIHRESYLYAAIPAFLLIFFVSRLTTRDIAKMDLVEVTRIRE